MKAVLFLSAFIMLALLSPPISASSVVEKLPTSTTVISAGWATPTNVYAYDGNYATTTATNAEQEYEGFDFNLASTVSIEKVYLKVKCCFEVYVQWDWDWFCSFKEKLYDGSSWTEYDAVYDYICWEVSYQDNMYFHYSSDVDGKCVVFDVSNFLDTYEKINNAKVRLQAYLEPIDQNWITLSVDAVSIEVVYSTGTSGGLSFSSGFILGGLVFLCVGLVVGVAVKKHN